MIRTPVSRIQWLKTWYAGLRLLADPERLDEVFVLAESLGSLEGARFTREQAISHERGRRAMRERYRVPPYSLAKLRAMPEGSLGRELAILLDARGLDPASLPRREVTSDDEYVLAHLYETHDHWHVLTGFGTDIPGELGVQAFYLAQLGGDLPRTLITGGLLHGLLWDLQDWDARLSAVRRGYDLGKLSQPIFGLRWDELWPRPLEEVRRELAITE
jgi:ubiquinone biosynthesis protein Coq4